MLRSIGAVVAGYLVFGLSAVALFRLSGSDPHSAAGAAFMAGSMVWGLLFGAAGGYTAARLAGRRSLAHAGAVGVLLAAIAAVSWLARPGGGAVWTQAAAILLFAPATLLGGWLHSRR